MHTAVAIIDIILVGAAILFFIMAALHVKVGAPNTNHTPSWEWLGFACLSATLIF